MDYELAIGSGFSLTVSAERLNAWCLRLRESGNARMRLLSAVHVAQTGAVRHPGVYWRQKTHSWRAMVWTGARWKHLGYFKDRDMAIRARQMADRERAAANS